MASSVVDIIVSIIGISSISKSMLDITSNRMLNKISISDNMLNSMTNCMLNRTLNIVDNIILIRLGVWSAYPLIVDIIMIQSVLIFFVSFCFAL